MNTLMAALEVEIPNVVAIRKGRYAGNQTSILKIILGDGDGNILKLTAWGIGADVQPPERGRRSVLKCVQFVFRMH